MKQFKKIAAVLLSFAMLVSMVVLVPPETKADSLTDVDIEVPAGGAVSFKGESFAIQVKPHFVGAQFENYIQIQILKDGKQVDFKNISYNSLDAVKTSYKPASAGSYTIRAGYSSVKQDTMADCSDTVKIKVVDPKKLSKEKPKFTVFRFSRTEATLTLPNWTNSKIEIYRATAKKGKYKKIKTVKSKAGGSYDDVKIAGKRTYYYKIRILKKVGSKKYYSKFSAVKAASTKGIPEITSLTYSKSKGVKITWTKSSYANEYFVIRRDGENYEFLPEVKAGTLFCYDKTVKPGKTYYYEIKAYNHKAGRGKASQEKKIKIPKS